VNWFFLIKKRIRKKYSFLVLEVTNLKKSAKKKIIESYNNSSSSNNNNNNNNNFQFYVVAQIKH
jgi:hypothetical protein